MTLELLTTKEVSEILKVSTWTLSQWRRKGIGPPYIQETEGSSVLYAKDELHQWLKRNQKQQAEA